MPKIKFKGIADKRKAFVRNCKKINKARLRYCNEFNVLGIDPSISSSGFCSRLEDKTEVWVKQPSRFSTGFAKVMEIEQGVLNSLEKTDYPFCGMEGYAYGKKWGRERLGELGGVIKRTLFLHKTPLLIIAPLTGKSWVKAKSKSQTMLEILDRFKIKISNEDAADAFIIADIVLRSLYISKHVAEGGYLSKDMLNYFKKEEYKEIPELSSLFKYQANSLFNLIAGHGDEVLFFANKKKPIKLKY